MKLQHEKESLTQQTYVTTKEREVNRGDKRKSMYVCIHIFLESEILKKNILPIIKTIDCYEK